jgi:hypothetical protein
LVVAKSEWLQALDDLPESEITRGISYCRKYGGEFPPSIPEFRKMCLPQPAELGIMSESDCYALLSRNNTEDFLVREIAKRIDVYNWRNLPAASARKVFKEVYEQCVDDLYKRYAENLNVPNLTGG